MKIVRKIFKFLFLGLIFVLVLELLSRVDDAIKWNADFTGNYSNDILTVSDSLGRHNRFGAQFEKWKINNYGFRGDDISIQKDQTVSRIIVVGASETFGLYETSGNEYSAQLQKLLDEYNPGSYEVLNAACAGMSPPRIIEYYENWLKRFDPDILIFYPSPAFYLDVHPPTMEMSTASSSRRNEKPQLRIKRKIRVVMKQFIPESWQVFIKKLMIKRMVSNHPEGWVWSECPADRLKLFSEHVTALLDKILSDGVKIIVATHATRFDNNLSPLDKRHLVGWRKFYPRASDKCLLEMETAANSFIRKLEGREGIKVVDIDSIVPAAPEYFADFAHFTDEGSSIVASAFAEAVLENKAQTCR